MNGAQIATELLQALDTIGQAHNTLAWCMRYHAQMCAAIGMNDRPSPRLMLAGEISAQQQQLRTVRDQLDQFEIGLNRLATQLAAETEPAGNRSAGQAGR